MRAPGCMNTHACKHHCKHPNTRSVRNIHSSIRRVHGPRQTQTPDTTHAHIHTHAQHTLKKHTYTCTASNVWRTIWSDSIQHTAHNTQHTAHTKPYTTHAHTRTLTLASRPSLHHPQLKCSLGFLSCFVFQCRFWFSNLFICVLWVVRSLDF